MSNPKDFGSVLYHNKNQITMHYSDYSTYTTTWCSRLPFTARHRIELPAGCEVNGIGHGVIDLIFQKLSDRQHRL